MVPQARLVLGGSGIADSTRLRACDRMDVPARRLSRRHGDWAGSCLGEHGGRERDDEWSGDPATEFLLDEGLHVIEQAGSVTLVHHLGA